MFNGNPGARPQQQINNDGFWPDLSADAFARQRDIPLELSGDVMAGALVNAASYINQLLQSQVNRWHSLGITTADAIPGLSVDGRSWALECYTHAVHARAKALLMPEFSSVVQRSEANNAYKQEDATRATLLAESDSHINRLLGSSDVRVVLI